MEWDIFSRKATSFLRDLEIEDISYHNRILKIMELPSLWWEPIKRWELHEDKVLKIEWFCHEDIKLFDGIANNLNSLTPTIKYRVAKVDKSYAMSIKDEISKISIPLNLDGRSSGIDGIDYEFEIGDYWTRVKVKWWCEIQESWGELGEVSKSLMKEFDEVLSDTEYLDTLKLSGKLLLIPDPDYMITKDIMKFLKQFSEVSQLNIVDIARIFKSGTPCVIDSNLAYTDYIGLQDEISKLNLKLKFEL